MSLCLTTLGENTAGRPRILAEWGLSILVETDGRRILLDTCASISVPHNASVMGVDLAGVDTIVLSHGHYDHTGGLKVVLKETGPVNIIGHPDIWDAKYVVRGGQEAYNGIPFSMKELEELGANFSLSAEPVWVTADVVTSGEVPMVTGYEQIDSYLFVKEHDRLVPDRFRDDLALVVKTDVGLVVVLGCAHRGMVNTLMRARELTGVDRIHTVVGGTHLITASLERVMHTVEAVKQLGIQRLGVSHCTGLPAAVVLACELGDVFFFNSAGSRITVP